MSDKVICLECDHHNNANWCCILLRFTNILFTCEHATNLSWIGKYRKQTGNKKEEDQK